jgi:hypothetical protein
VTGQVFFKNAAPDIGPYYCDENDDWQPMAGGGSGGTVDPAALKSALWCLAASASGTTYTCSTTNSSALSIGQTYLLGADVANTGNVTFNINGLGAKSVLWPGGDQFASGEVGAGAFILVVYNGTSLEALNAPYSANPGVVRLGCGTAPATPPTDFYKVYCESDTLKGINDAGTVVSFGAGGSSAFDPATAFEFFEEFNSGGASDGQYGGVGWKLTNVGGADAGITVTTAASTVAHTGILVLRDGTSDNDSYALWTNALADGSTNLPYLLGSSGLPTWQMDIIFYTTSYAGVGLWLGVGGGYNDRNGDSIGLRFDSDNDSTIKYQTCQGGGTCTNTDSTVTPAGNTWYHLKVVCTTPGTVVFTLNGANSATVSTNVPTTDLLYRLNLTNRDTTSEDFAVDLVGIKGTLTR